MKMNQGRNGFSKITILASYEKGIYIIHFYTDEKEFEPGFKIKFFYKSHKIRKLGH